MRTKRLKKIFAVTLGGALLLLPVAASLAADLGIRLSVPQSELAKLDGAIVYVHADSLPAKDRQHTGATIRQQRLQFSPYITAIQAGTEVSFPNLDKTSHHVYSFSPAKQFELPLYSSALPNPVVFDRAGVVVLGCNIHDWMLAYILVVDSPYFQPLENGLALFSGLPPGRYRVNLWHPRLDRREPELSQWVDLTQQDLEIALAPKYPAAGGGQPVAPPSGLDLDVSY